jgi:polyisoprenyl-phosphate glycosyltransferase
MISVIVPVYNEEENIKFTYETLKGVLEEMPTEYEILFSDNNSEDKSWALISELADSDTRVRGIKYSRNFGYQRSIYQAYLECKGECAIQIDCDLQDPPSLIPVFYEKWDKKGYKAVFGVRKSRKEGQLMNWSRKLFYRTLNFLSDEGMPPDVGEFRLIDRKIIEVLRIVGDHQPYLRGLVSTLGFKQYFYSYTRERRQVGVTKFHFCDLISIGMDGFLNYSIVPLRIAFYIGIFTFGLSIILSIGYICLNLFSSRELPAGFTTITLLLLYGFGANAIFIGIIGEYLGRVYRQLKKMPIAIIEERKN